MLASRGLVIPQHEYRCIYTFHWHWYGTTYGNDRLRDGIRLTVISSKSDNIKYECIKVREYEGYWQSMQYKTSPYA